MNYLKQELYRALCRERNIKNELEKVMQKGIELTEQKVESLMRAEEAARSEVERWMMRNEELESRLLDGNKKIVSLKKLLLTAEDTIKAQNVQEDQQRNHYEKIKKLLIRLLEDVISSTSELQTEVRDRCLQELEGTLQILQAVIITISYGRLGID